MSAIPMMKPSVSELELDLLISVWRQCGHRETAMSNKSYRFTDIDLVSAV
eukprot:m.112857 g.112857  ORF g.112857 m.112857 type:complete len:50 (+) comp21443_c0_seq1:1425-1574(+)